MSYLAAQLLMLRLIIDAYLTRFASFSSWLMAATSAAARSTGVALVSQILLDFKGPLMQSGPAAPSAMGIRDVAITSATVENNTIMRTSRTVQKVVSSKFYSRIFIPSPSARRARKSRRAVFFGRYLRLNCGAAEAI